MPLLMVLFAANLSSAYAANPPSGELSKNVLSTELSGFSADSELQTGEQPLF